MHDDTPAHEVLGIEPSASVSEIRSAYKRLAREVHPDRDASPDAASRFMRVKAAHDEMLERREREAGPGWKEVAQEVRSSGPHSWEVRPDRSHVVWPIDDDDAFDIRPEDVYRTILWTAAVIVWFAFILTLLTWLRNLI